MNFVKRVLVLSISFCLAFFISVAQAHTTLVSSDPQPDSRIQTWPTHITLTFGEPLQVLSGVQLNKILVTNAEAHSLEGLTRVAGNVVDVDVASNSAEGPVLINYRVVAQDGHVLEGEYSFNYKKGAAPSSLPTKEPHHLISGSSANFALVATSTILIVSGLLFGLFIYRRS